MYNRCTGPHLSMLTAAEEAPGGPLSGRGLAMGHPETQHIAAPRTSLSPWRGISRTNPQLRLHPLHTHPVPQSNPRSTGQQSWIQLTSGTSKDYTGLLNIINTQNISTLKQHTNRFVVLYLSKSLVCPVSKTPGGIADPSAGLCLLLSTDCTRALSVLR